MANPSSNGELHRHASGNNLNKLGRCHNKLTDNPGLLPEYSRTQISQNTAEPKSPSYPSCHTPRPAQPEHLKTGFAEKHKFCQSLSTSSGGLAKFGVPLVPPTRSCARAHDFRTNVRAGLQVPFLAARHAQAAPLLGREPFSLSDLPSFQLQFYSL